MDENKQNQVDEGANLLKDLRAKISEVETLLTEAKQNAKNIVNYLNSKQRISDEKIKGIEINESKITATSGSVSTLLTQIQSKMTEAEGIQKQLIELRQRMDDPATGIESTLKKITEKETKVGEHVKNAEANVDQIKSLQVSAASIDEEIKKNKEEVEKYKKEIEKIYGFITGSGLSHSFGERRSGLKWSVLIWAGMTFVGVMLLVAILYFIFKNPLQNGANWLELFLYKVTYSSPGIFLIWFSALQYSRAQRLLESYAFKAATAKALENYTDVLTKRFPDDQSKDKIREFVLTSMENIYKHPNQDGLSKEETELESNAIKHISETIKGFGEKVWDPLQQLSEKIKTFTFK